MMEVLVMVSETSRHECWEAAIERVATVARLPREVAWLRGAADGVFVVDGRQPDPHVPVAWITDPVRYRRAASRGDLEDVPTFFHAGPELGTPTRQPSETTTP